MTTTTRHHPPARRAGRRAPALLGALFLAFALTACGSGGSEGTGANADAGSDEAKAQDAMLDYAQCMRDNGVPMEDPEPGGGVMIDGGAVDPEAARAAEEECGHLLEGALPDDAEMGISAEEKEALLAQAACMRERGWNVPDPQFDRGGVKMQLEEGIDPSDPSFAADHQACAEEAGLDLPVVREGGE